MGPALLSVGNAFVGFGAEVVLSIGSGEAALYITDTIGSACELPNIATGLEIYDGVVFNLWNAKDYHGPFESLSLSLDMRVKGGGSLFWDTNRGFDDPWGVAITLFSKSFGLFNLRNLNGFSFGKSNINYDMWESVHRDRFEIIREICEAIAAKNMIKSSKIGLSTALFGLTFGMSNWMNIGFAHHYWNAKEPQYDIDTRRRIDDRREVPGYRSGPSYWLIPGI